MKKTMVLMIVILMIGGSVFAQGNLLVNGGISIGTGSEPTKELDVIGNAVISNAGGSSLYLTPTTSTTTGGIGLYVSALHNGNEDVALKGANYIMNFEGAEDNSDATWTKAFASQQNSMGFRNTSFTGTYDITGNFRGGWYNVNRGANNQRNWNVLNYYGIDLTSDDSGYGSGVLAFNNLYQIHIGDFDDEETGSLMTAENYAGIWIDALDGATNNYGIVLAGDGAGSDIVFGADQEASIYSSGGVLYASDNNFNATQISPHDPETGEWVFYSKNTKTGKVMKVNMEKLIKAVEKLTGEKFMIETYEDIEKAVD